MSVRYDPILARALAAEIAARWDGRRALGLVLDRGARRAELRFEDEPSLLFLLHPEAGFLLPWPAAGGAPDHRFRRLGLGAVAVPPDERFLFLTLADARGRARHRVACELHTNQWNLLLLDTVEDEGDRIRAALWPRETRRRALRAGERYELPPSDRRGADEPLSRQAWMELLAPLAPERRRGALLREVAWTSSLNADWILGGAVGESADAEGAGPALEAAHTRYRALWERVADRGERRTPGEEPGAWLLEREWGLQPYPADLDDPDARPVGSLLEGMEEAARATGAPARFLGTGERAGGAGGAGAAAPGETAAGEEAAALREALLARRNRLRRRVAALERERERGEDPAALREVGNLILARLKDVPRGRALVRLPDFVGGERDVELDPALEPAANAEAYFERAKRRERAAARIPEEIGAARAHIGRVEEALEALDEEGPSGALWEAAGGRPDAGEDGGERGPRLPYLRYRSSGGLEIRVGRGAGDNDDLTFHHSSPEDVWLHARQVQGAHVILRWGKREENPPQRDLVEAAVAAAVHSGARHSGTVPVDWTRRKYVRKPRKAPPGAVLPERVQTVFVEPDESFLERLRTG